MINFYGVDVIKSYLLGIMAGTVAAVVGAAILSLMFGAFGAQLTGTNTAPPIAEVSLDQSDAKMDMVNAGSEGDETQPDPALTSVSNITALKGAPQLGQNLAGPQIAVTPAPTLRAISDRNAPVLANVDGNIFVDYDPSALAIENPAPPAPIIAMQAHAQLAVLGPNPDISIILMIDAQNSFGAEAFANFPHPIAFAIDTAWAGAPAMMQKLRAAGHEVLAQVAPLTDSGASDVAALLQKATGVLPQSVGVIDRPDASLQNGFGQARGAVDTIADTGRGLILHDTGLNPALALASRARLPAVLVDVVFDDQAGSPAQIRARIDEASALATQDDPVIMLGHLRPDTISALFLWGLSDGPKMKDIIPVSAQLWAAQEALEPEAKPIETDATMPQANE